MWCPIGRTNPGDRRVAPFSKESAATSADALTRRSAPAASPAPIALRKRFSASDIPRGLSSPPQLLDALRRSGDDFRFLKRQEKPEMPAKTKPAPKTGSMRPTLAEMMKTLAKAG